MSMFWELQAMLAKVETVYGVDSAPAAANGILAQNVRLSPMEATEVARQHARPYQGARPSALVGKHMRVTFEVEVKGSGTAGTPPAFGVLLRACKCAEVIVAATSVTYNPISAAHESVSLYWYLDGVLFKIIGCRGTWQYKLNADGIVVIEFTMTGLFTKPSAAALPTPTYGTQLTQMPQVATTENTPTFSIGAWTAAVLRSFTFNAGNQVTYRGLIRKTQIIIPSSEERAEFQIEMEPLATFDPFTLADAGTTSAVSLVHGVGAGKIATLSIPNLQILNPGDLSQQDGIAEYQLRGKCLPGASGNDQFTLAFT
jgi:hypothetical protein